VEDAVRRRGVVKAAIILWSLLAVAGIVAGRYWWNGASLLGVTAHVVAAVLAGTAVLQAMRRRKFGASKLTLKSSPALLGGRLEGEVTTGVRRETPPREEFRLRLRCIHSWEETRYDAGTTNRRTYTHHDVLWEQEQRDPGRPSPARPGRLAVPVGFDLPPDKPPTDLDQADSDIRWELEISAAVPGLDYRSTFRLPVFHPDDAPDASPPPAGR
jgi:hypothetical protein